ncbi:18874_t:CDS:10 [Funneliformis geosporum]|uniref:Cullin-5 n=1 Tax=Funneliformis geosporum TaxID=1117311 RepID=A0A9W4SBU9_9GLOM|nr:18874_t:CDS:10 [Funneliformis geosporum]
MTLRSKRVVFEKAFAEFRQDLEKMFNFTGLDQVSGMKMYQLVYDMCTATPRPHTEKLFNAIAGFLNDYTIQIRASILNHDDVVSAYAREWKHYSLAAGFSSMICDYLNKLLVNSKSRAISDRKMTVQGGNYRRQTVQALAYLIWKKQIVYSIKEKHSDRFMHQIFEMIRRDRDGEDTVPDVVSDAIISLVELNNLTENPLSLYIEEFEKPYLKNTRRYYERESAALMLFDIIKQASQRLYEEKARNSKYCHQSSHDIIIKECETQYIAVHQTIIQGEFEAMISNERYEDCTMAYTLLSCIPSGVNPLLEIFERYITNIGKGLIVRMGNSIAKDPREYVESLLNHHSKYLTVCQKVFVNGAAFVAAVDKALRAIVNNATINPIAHSPEVMARYCDVLLKKTHKGGWSELEVEDKLNRMIILFKYIEDKDVYQKFYSRMLAKRLIYGNSASEEAEMNMISRLKSACGVEYTSKLQRMFTDITISADVNKDFSDFLKKNPMNIGVDFSILVLTAGAWPLTQISATEFQLPTELEKSVTHFSTFYSNQHSGRRLTWLWHLSKADVKLTYLDKRYEFSVSLYQLGVLLLYNGADMFTFKEIIEHTGLNDQELRRVMKPMIDLAVFIVSKPSGSLSDETEIKLNLEFSNKRNKIKVSSSLQAETPQETDATRKAVDDDRKLYLQAAIVRVMKSRKTLTHAQLIKEVIDQARSRFTPNVPMIKKLRLEGREIPVDIDYSQGTSVQAVLERACRTLGIYDSWNYALYSELFKTWLCDSHLLSSYPAEDTLVVRKKTPEYLELVYNEENPKKRSVSSNGLSPNTSVQTIKRLGVFSSTKTCLKTRFQPETIYLSAILFTSDNKVLITSSAKMFPTVEVIKDSIIFGNVEDDSEEFAHVIRTSLDWATSTDFDTKEDNSSDSDSFHSSQSNSSNGTTGDFDHNHSQFYGDQDTPWSRAFGQAALRLKNELSLESLGILYEHVVYMNTSKSKFIVALQHVPNCIREEIAPDLIKSGTLKWKSFEESNSIYQKDPHPVWSNYIEKWCSRQTKLSPGLYLGVLYTESTLQGIKILVPKDRKQFIPLGKVRDEARITPEEASWIKSLTCLSQDCFVDSVMATKSDKNHNKSTLGQFQTSFLDCYYKLQHDTSLNWDSGDIYSDQTVDIYLDLQTNQMYTMMGELDDNIIEQCGNFSSSPTDLYLDPNGEEEKDKLKELQKSQKEEKSEEQKRADKHQGFTQDEQDDYTININFDSPDKENILSAASAPESEVEDDVGSIVKTCTSTGAATSIAEEAVSHMASSFSSFNTGNTIRPFIRIIMIVKPMRQPHHIRGPYYSRLCMLYPFPLYDALQHATFNTSLYACSRRAMQILQASRTYFTQELVRHLQKVDNFSEVNEQNLEDFFFDPDEFNKFPDDARRIQQAIDVIRDEIVTLRQQWNAASWTMTAIEWDRQRTMQAYSFGGRPMTLNVSKSAGQSRAASVYNLSLSNNNDDESPNRKRLSTTSRISTADTVSHIEILRDVMFHAPDRAWILAAYLASLPVLATPTLKRSPSISSTISTISSNASSGAINPLPSRKKSAGHRLMRTFGFGGNHNGKKFLSKRANSKKIKEVQIDDQSSIINFESDDTITIIVPPRSQTPLTSSFTNEPTKLEVETMEIQHNDISEEHESSTNSQQEIIVVAKDVEISSQIVINNFEKEDLNENVDDTNEHDDSSKVITENDDEEIQYENKTIIESESMPNHQHKTVEMFESELKSTSQMESETFTIPHNEESNFDDAEMINISTIEYSITSSINTFLELAGREEESPADEIIQKKNITQIILDSISEISEEVINENIVNDIINENESEDEFFRLMEIFDNINNEENTVMEKEDETVAAMNARLDDIIDAITDNLCARRTSPTTPHFPPPLFLRSISPTPSAPYFPAEILYSPETSIPKTPDFPPPELSNEFSAPPTPQLVPQTLSEIDSDSPPLVPLSSPSSVTPLHTSIPSTPQFSPSAQNSRPSTPQFNTTNLFEELKHAKYRLDFQYKSPPSTLYEELTKSPPPFQYSRPPTPQVSPPISPSSLPPLPLSTPSTPATPRSILSASQSLFSAQASSNTTLTDLPETTSQPSTTKSSSSSFFPILRTTTPPPLKVNTNSISSFKSTLSSPIPSMIPRPPIFRSLSVLSTPPPLPLSSSTRPPPLPLPPSWPKLKKTKRPEPKKNELEPEVDQSDFRRKPRSRAASFSEGSGLEMKNILNANYHPQRAASELGFNDVAEHNNDAGVDLEPQKIINDNDEALKITSNNSNNNSVTVNGFKTPFIKSQTKNNKNLFIIKKLKKVEYDGMTNEDVQMNSM